MNYVLMVKYATYDFPFHLNNRPVCMVGVDTAFIMYDAISMFNDFVEFWDYLRKRHMHYRKLSP